MNRSADTGQQKHDYLWILPITILCLLLVFATHPFLKLPYDPWEHLIKIRSIYDTGECFLYWPENLSNFCGWHRSWAVVFSLLSIDDALTWASVIHYTQFISALVCLFYFSSSVLRLLAKDLPGNQILLASFISTLFWLVGNGTYSVEYQQAWVMWYSVTYQGATIPLFWLITAMLLQIFFDDDLSSMKKRLFVVCIIIGIGVIAVFHPSEAVYFFIFFFLSLVFTPLVKPKRKLIGVIAFLILIVCAFYLVDLFYHLPFLHRLGSWSGFISLVQQMQVTGADIVGSGINRVNNSFSELAMFSAIAALGYWIIHLIWAKGGSKSILTLLVAAIVIFYLIPTNRWLAGTAGIVLDKYIVWRFFFASPWFLFIPLIALKLAQHYRFPKLIASALLVVVLVGSFYVSDRYLHRALAGNIQSLWNSVDKQDIGPQYSQEKLLRLKQELEQRTEGYDKERTLLYMRGDIASIARALYGYYVYSHRRVFIPMRKFYADRMDRRYELLPIITPPGFPKDPKVFSHFNLDTKSISELYPYSLEGTSRVVFDVGSTDVGRQYLFITGWAFLESQNGDPQIYIILASDSNTFVYDSSELFRKDVGKHFKIENFLSPGFVATIPVGDLSPGLYRVGIMVTQGSGQGYVMTSRTITIPESGKAALEK